MPGVRHSLGPRDEQEGPQLPSVSPHQLGRLGGVKMISQNPFHRGLEKGATQEVLLGRPPALDT